MYALSWTAVDANRLYEERQESSAAQERSPLTVEAWRRCRTVLQNLLNLLHDLRCQLLEKLHGLHVVLDLLCLCCSCSNVSYVPRRASAKMTLTEYDGADVRILDAPGDAQLADITTQLLRDLSELQGVSNGLGTMKTRTLAFRTLAIFALPSSV